MPLPHAPSHFLRGETSRADSGRRWSSSVVLSRMWRMTTKVSDNRLASCGAWPNPLVEEVGDLVRAICPTVVVANHVALIGELSQRARSLTSMVTEEAANADNSLRDAILDSVLVARSVGRAVSGFSKYICILVEALLEGSAVAGWQKMGELDQVTLLQRVLNDQAWVCPFALV